MGDTGPSLHFAGINIFFEDFIKDTIVFVFRPTTPIVRVFETHKNVLVKFVLIDFSSRGLKVAHYRIFTHITNRQVGTYFSDTGNH